MGINLNLVDLVTGVIMFIGIAIGFSRGLVREISGILSGIISVYSSHYIVNSLSVSQYLNSNLFILVSAFIISFILLFIIIKLSLELILNRLEQNPILKVISKILGAFISGLKTYFTLGIGMMLYLASIDKTHIQPVVAQSVLVPYFKPAINYITHQPILHSIMPECESVFKKIEDNISALQVSKESIL